MKKIYLILLLTITTQLYAKQVGDFSLPIYGQDKEFNLKKEAQNYNKIVVNFWASWCTACIKELKELEHLKASNVDKKVLFVAINAGEKKKKIKKFLRKYKFSYLILEDKNRIVSKSLGIEELPRTLVINKDLSTSYNSNIPPKDI